MAANSIDEDRRRSVRSDLLQSSHTGAPPLGHLVGLHRSSVRGHHYALALEPSRPALAGGSGLLEVTMLADLALGGAIRDRAGLTLPLPTIAMTIQLAAERTSEVLWADAEYTTTHRARTATSRSRLRTASGDVVGDAVGTFALPALPYTGPGRAMPWDIPADEAAGGIAPERELSDSEQDTVERVAAHAAAAPPRAWGSAHLDEQLVTAADQTRLSATSLMSNRLGNVQGGVLFCTAVVAAACHGEMPADSFSTGTIEFLDAATVEQPVLASVTTLRKSPRSYFAAVVLTQEDRKCCHVSVVFRQ